MEGWGWLPAPLGSPLGRVVPRVFDPRRVRPSERVLNRRERPRSRLRRVPFGHHSPEGVTAAELQISMNTKTKTLTSLCNAVVYNRKL